MQLLFEQTWVSALIRISIVLGLVFGVYVYIMVWAERKLSAFMQDRIGPNRVGPFGIFQGVADGIKFLFKETITPVGVYKPFYLLAPVLAVFPAMLALAAVPMGVHEIEGRLYPLVIADLNIGVLFVIAVASLSVYAIILGGWASNSKYPIMGGLRAAAQLISYEVPLGLTILSVLLLAGSARLTEIVWVQQQHAWFVFLAPLGFWVFLCSMFAETNRLPFDLPEGETEIIGFHAEYTGFRFAMFFMAEYANMVMVSALMVLMFFGGWEFLPFIGWDKVSNWMGVNLYADPILWLVPTLWFLLKLSAFLFLFIWVRWTLPRFRYDQLMRLGWKRLVPLSFVNLLICTWIAMRLGS